LPDVTSDRPDRASPRAGVVTGGKTGRGDRKGGFPRLPLADPVAARLSGRMAKLYFHYSTMNAGKSTLLLQAS